MTQFADGEPDLPENEILSTRPDFRGPTVRFGSNVERFPFRIGRRPRSFFFTKTVLHPLMKLSPILTLIPALLLTGMTVHADQTFQQILSQAQTEYLRGEMDAAKRDFQTIQKADPRNQTAISYLRLIQIAEEKEGGTKGNEKDLAGIIIPHVEFKEATLDSTLDALKKTVAKVTNDKKSVNFVSQLPPELAAKQVTLSLSNVPFVEVLKYLGSVADVRFVFEKYAIIVKPASAPAGNPAPADANKTQQ